VSIFDILKQSNFKFKKNLGQNFITDKNILASICADSQVSKSDIVLEIGAGAGTLTLMLAQIAERVIAFEIDETLKPVLSEVLKDSNTAEIKYLNVLKASDEEISALTENRPFKVVANLPYYITAPLIMRFIESTLPVQSLTLTLQKEVAERITALPGSSEYGSITLAVKIFGDPQITRILKRDCFIPSPNVDSAVVHIKKRTTPIIVKDIAVLRKLIRAGFAMRRKTLVNNIATIFNVDKNSIKQDIGKLGFLQTVRGEDLSLEEYIKIADFLVDMNYATNH
jgi:16S rRNA (adenine1518-N6/adenine1519-N6)-dimethyltransferase